VDIYGNEKDLCSNVRTLIESFGFVFLGSFAENHNADASGDMAFASPEVLDIAKKCVSVFQGKMSKNENTEDCLGKSMYDHPDIGRNGIVL